MEIRTRRVYETPATHDGQRVLVDRIWPRGLSREQAALDDWLRDLAPSTELRRWFGHDPERWETFCRRYHDELARQPAAVAGLLERGRQGTLTLVYAARDTEHNNAVALKAYLLNREAV